MYFELAVAAMLIYHLKADARKKNDSFDKEMRIFYAYYLSYIL